MSCILSSGKQELRIEKAIMNSSGMLGFSDESRNQIDLQAFGAFITNPVSLYPRTPARGPRLIALPDSILLHTGLPNPGLDHVISDHQPRWDRMEVPIIIHTIARDRDEMIKIIDRLESVDSIQAIEVGLMDKDHENDYQIFTAACAGLLPAIARLPVTAPVSHIQRLEQIGAAAIALGPPRGVLFHNDQSVNGRLYGPGLLAQSIHACLRVIESLDCPLIAGSGIFSRTSAERLLEAGVAALQLDTVLWTDPDHLLEPSL